MRNTSSGPTIPLPLRANAEALLTSGAAPPTRQTLGTDALSLLFRLASSQATAAEGLKLLHELQVHQVELDLQHEQFESAEQQLAGNLRRYQSLFEHAPLGYLIVGRDGRVIEGNHAAAALVGVERESLQGHPLAGLLALASREPLLALLATLNAGAAGASCDVTLRDAAFPAGESRQMQITAKRSPDDDTLMMIVCECAA